jgi:hypothetical protein
LRFLGFFKFFVLCGCGSFRFCVGLVCFWFAVWFLAVLWLLPSCGKLSCGCTSMQFPLVVNVDACWQCGLWQTQKGKWKKTFWRSWQTPLPLYKWAIKISDCVYPRLLAANVTDYS